MFYIECQKKEEKDANGLLLLFLSAMSLSRIWLPLCKAFSALPTADFLSSCCRGVTSPTESASASTRGDLLHVDLDRVPTTVDNNCIKNQTLDEVICKKYAICYLLSSFGTYQKAFVFSKIIIMLIKV